MPPTFDGFSLCPRDGAVLRVLVIARISTTHQDPRSLDDQAALCQRYLSERYPGPVQVTRIQGQGSGEFLDRKDLAEAEAAVESRRYDLVLVEDLGRICRRNRALDFCELCEDAGTRLVAINDAIDTARDDWRLNAFFASFRHESANKETSKRIRRSLRHRFEQGGVVQTVIYGYSKPPGAKSDADVQKKPEAERVYDEVFRRLEAGASYAEVADWLNAEGVLVGERARGDRWDGRMLARVVHNPILKGVRVRNARKSVRVNRTGRRKSVKAPAAERLERHCPRLAFIESDRYDRVVALLKARNDRCTRGRGKNAPDVRSGVPKKRTVWPGQHVVCGVCGRPYYWGGHGQAARMMCAGARDYACWNAATFDGREAGPRFAAAVLACAEALPAFDEVFRDKVEGAALARRSVRADALDRLGREIGQADRELANLVRAIAQSGISPALQAGLREAEVRKARLTAERADLLGQPDDVPTLPPVEELKERARAAVGRLAFADPAFGRQMHQLVPVITIFPYRPLDGGAVVLRAELAVNLAPLLGPAGDVVGELIRHRVLVDLFDPPQRVAFRAQVAALREAGRTERAAARELGLTVTAAQRAMALHRLMEQRGQTDPYQLLTSPPDGEGKFRRHQHDRYRFRPLDGYPARPALDRP